MVVASQVLSLKIHREVLETESRLLLNNYVVVVVAGDTIIMPIFMITTIMVYVVTHQTRIVYKLIVAYRVLLLYT